MTKPRQKRPPLLGFADAKRLFDAAKKSGWARARLSIVTPDNLRVEVLADDGSSGKSPSGSDSESAFENWKAVHARKNKRDKPDSA
ncbi:hypothetical protein [Castellaniella sp.]|uniref:hypothetical protein n=1 Tax=Castellaniella sp. TaxID=1955812 RepID=UPI002AFE5FEE|nr:hypothetical protein [Castellaniella sp.]